MLALIFAPFAAFPLRASAVDITNTFTDPNFLTAVLGVLGKSAGDPINDTDVAGIDYLYVAGMNRRRSRFGGTSTATGKSRPPTRL